MEIYLVPNGNSILWMEKHVAGVREFLNEKQMPPPKIDIDILLSFMYPNEDVIRLIPCFRNFFLDSGAFTFAQGKRHQNFEEYTERYIEFVKKYKIQNFLEMDIDGIIGYEKVKELRKKIERGVGRQCIPVWHINRGKQEFLNMCDEYKYVAIGGIPRNAPEMWRYFPWFIKQAHMRGAKIHGLGFTSFDGLKKYHFDSVDSSAWTVGNRFGCALLLEGGRIKRIQKPKGKEIRAVEMAVHNFGEWVKFARWARTHL